MHAGTRAVREAILQPALKAELQVFVVWTSFYGADSRQAAQAAASQLGGEIPVKHFYDPQQRAGKAIAQGFGAPAGEVAWDIYLFYGRDVTWGEQAPVPVDWAHQLGDCDWASPAHYFCGDELARRLGELIQMLTRDGRQA